MQNSPQKLTPKWFVLADSEKARLLQGTLTGHGRPHLDECSTLQTSFAPGQHQRPSALTGKGHPAHASLGHEHEEKLSHFARELSSWLQKELDARKIERCQLYAPARFLGALRKALPKSLQAKVVENDAEIANLTLAQLNGHPAITGHLG